MQSSSSATSGGFDLTNPRRVAAAALAVAGVGAAAFAVGYGAGKYAVRKERSCKQRQQQQPGAATRGSSAAAAAARAGSSSCEAGLLPPFGAEDSANNGCRFASPSDADADALLSDIAELEEAARNAAAGASHDGNDDHPRTAVAGHQQQQQQQPPSSNSSSARPLPSAEAAAIGGAAANTQQSLSANTNGSTNTPLTDSNDGDAALMMGASLRGGARPPFATARSGSAAETPLPLGGSQQRHQQRPVSNAANASSSPSHFVVFNTQTSSNPVSLSGSANPDPSFAGAGGDHPLHSRMAALKLSMLASSQRSEGGERGASTDLSGRATPAISSGGGGAVHATPSGVSFGSCVTGASAPQATSLFHPPPHGTPTTAIIGATGTVDVLASPASSSQQRFFGGVAAGAAGGGLPNPSVSGNNTSDFASASLLSARAGTSPPTAASGGQQQANNNNNSSSPQLATLVTPTLLNVTTTNSSNNSSGGGLAATTNTTMTAAAAAAALCNASASFPLPIAPAALPLATRRQSAVYHSADGGILTQAAFTHHTTLKRMPAWPIWRVCVTGGPCSGKSTSMPIIKAELEACGFRVYLVPEVATLMINGGLEFSNMTREKRISQQTVILQTIMMLEDSFYELAKGSLQPAVLLCDRGTLDGSAYCSAAEFEEILGATGYTIAELRDARYDAIVHLVTTAIGAKGAYTTANNEARRESAEEAADLDRLTREKWNGHRLLGVFDNSTTFSQKCSRVVQFIKRIARIPDVPKKLPIGAALGGGGGGGGGASAPAAKKTKKGKGASKKKKELTSSTLPIPFSPPTSEQQQRTSTDADEGTPSSAPNAAPQTAPASPLRKDDTESPSSSQASSSADDEALASGTQQPPSASAPKEEPTAVGNNGGDATSSDSSEYEDDEEEEEGGGNIAEAPSSAFFGGGTADLSSRSIALGGVHKKVRVKAILPCGLPPSAVETEYLTITLDPSPGFAEEKLVRQRTAGGGVVESRRTDGAECNVSTLYFYVVERDASHAFGGGLIGGSAAAVTGSGPIDVETDGPSPLSSSRGVANARSEDSPDPTFFLGTKTEEEEGAVAPITSAPATATSSGFTDGGIIPVEKLVEVSPSTVFAVTGTGSNEGDNIVAGNVGHLRLSHDEFEAIRRDGSRRVIEEVRKTQYTFFSNEKYFTLVKYEHPVTKLALVAPFDCEPADYPPFFEYMES